MERFCAELTAAQRRAGLSPSALVHHAAGTPVAVADGLPLHRATSFGRLLFAPLAPGWPLALRRALAAERPQLLHLHLPNPSAFWLLFSPAARGLPWVVHWHADIPLDSEHLGLRLGYPLYRRFEHRLLARAAAVIATSRRYAEASRALDPVRARLHVVPLGIDRGPPPAAVAPAWPAAGLRLLAVGRLSFYKGFETLIDALAGVAGASLLLIGSGEQRPALERRIRAAGLESRVRLLGQADDTTLEAAYRGCDVLCLPSLDRSEAFGMVLLEAMRAGKPVLASDIPGSGVGEVVADGVTGELVPCRDAAAWGAAIARVAAQPERYAAMGRAGRQRWRERYSIDPVAAAITTIYRGLLPGPGPDPAAGSPTPAAAAPHAAAAD
jgi:glycosyltransferase involved in cell wall biosynthesis